MLLKFTTLPVFFAFISGQDGQDMANMMLTNSLIPKPG